MARPRSRKPGVHVPLKPSALAVDDLDEWARELSLRDLHSVARAINEQFYWWMGWPTSARADALLASVPLIRGCINGRVLAARWSEIKGPKRAKRIAAGPYEVHIDNKGAMIWGPKLAELAPELVDVHAACVAAIKVAGGTTLERAEAWLWPIALDAHTDGALEAVVYFASRGASPLTAEEVSRRWYSAVCDEVARGLERESPEMAKRAHARSISLEDAALLLRRQRLSLRLLTCGHSEDASIDATFLRAVDWLDVPGFGAWVESAGEWLAAGPDSGVDSEAAWSLFLALRADRALAAAGPDAMQAWAFRFIGGGLEKGKPWIELNWREAGTRVRLAVAASLTFFWYRARPGVHAPAAVDEAIALLSSSQLGDGAWPILSGDGVGCLLTTCVAMHALGVARPQGFETLTQKAAAWLATQQDAFGYWHVQGGPTTLVTVLALDSLAIAAGSDRLTFARRPVKALQSSEEQGHEKVVEPDYVLDGQPWKDPVMPELRSLPRSEVSLPQAPVLLAVATDVELGQVLYAMRPPYRKQKIQKVSSPNGTYFVGRLGSFAVVCIQCTMGPDGPSGATLTVDHAIRDWSPRAVIMPGIAFGMHRGKHQPGDVLIARSLVPYELQRVGQETQFRSARPESNHVLLARFRGAVDWVFPRPDGTYSARFIGPMLTGSKLIDSEGFKESLLTQFPDVVGGEMEGAGVWSASQKNNTPWIIVKGVCDWADGRKGNKFQELAAAAAVSLCLHVLQDEHALDGIAEPSRGSP